MGQMNKTYYFSNPEWISIGTL